MNAAAGLRVIPANLLYLLAGAVVLVGVLVGVVATVGRRLVPVEPPAEPPPAPPADPGEGA